MNLEIPIAISVVKFFAVLARVSAFVFAFPVFGSRAMPQKYKVFFVLMLSILLLPAVPDQWLSNSYFRNLDMFKLILMLTMETLLGLTIAMVVMILGEIFHFAGFMIDRNMGFVMARVVDPSSGVNTTVMSGVLYQLFILMFLITNSHHELIRLTATSFETLGAGEFLLTAGMAQSVIGLSGQIFVTGLQIAFPIFATIMFMNIGMGLMARIGQDFPVLMLSFPLRIGIGLLILISTMPIIISICGKTNQQLIEQIARIIGL